MQYDIILVGTGPSSSGILHALIQNSRTQSRPNTKTNPKIHIAVLAEESSPISSTSSPSSTTPDVNSNPFEFGNKLITAFRSPSSLPASLRVLHSTVTSGPLRGRSIEFPQGKTVGGSTNVNAMLFTPPGPSQFPLELGAKVDTATPWGQFVTENNVEASAASITSFLVKSRALTLNLPDHDYLSQLRKKTAAPEPPSDSTYSEFYTSVSSTIHSRMNSFDSLVLPLLLEMRNNPDNFTTHIDLIYDSKAEKVVFDSDLVATGVALSSGKTISTNKNGEIILCAGAIFSPLLLMRSGIGNFGKLRTLGLPTMVESDFVGAQVLDHLIVPRLFWTNKVGGGGGFC